jgi:hypothetical protein
MENALMVAEKICRKKQGRIDGQQRPLSPVPVDPFSFSVSCVY